MEQIEMNRAKKTNRTVEKTLGIIGSALGIIGGLTGLVITTIGWILGTENSFKMTVIALSALLLCIVTLILSCLIEKDRIAIGIILIIGGLLDIFLMEFMGYLSCILIIVAGIIALVRK